MKGINGMGMKKENKLIQVGILFSAALCGAAMIGRSAQLSVKALISFKRNATGFRVLVSFGPE
jgi:hypothetical protein